ncbi:MAG: tRNA adenosine(34) deaminase TadA [Acidobacteriota bacterium]
MKNSSQSTSTGERTHDHFMKLAIEAAKRARHLGEVPIGAVIEFEGEVIGTGFNQPIRALDPTAHAEIGALRQAARALDNYRLTGASLYVTIEPCIMCLGALLHARIGTLVYGAADPKCGAIESVFKLGTHRQIAKQLTVVRGVLEVDCRKLLQEFFKFKREEDIET